MKEIEFQGKLIILILLYICKQYLAFMHSQEIFGYRVEFIPVAPKMSTSLKNYFKTIFFNIDSILSFFSNFSYFFTICAYLVSPQSGGGSPYLPACYVFIQLNSIQAWKWFQMQKNLLLSQNNPENITFNGLSTVPMNA